MSPGQPRTIVVGGARTPTVSSSAGGQKFVILQSRSQTPTGTSQQLPPTQVQQPQQQIKVVSATGTVQQKPQVQSGASKVVVVGMSNTSHSGATSISQASAVKITSLEKNIYKNYLLIMAYTYRIQLRSNKMCLLHRLRDQSVPSKIMNFCDEFVGK